MLKVMTIAGTRPELIRLSRVIARLDEHTNHTLVHTGQNFDYELNEIFFKELGIRRPDELMDVAGGSPADTIGKVICQADRVIAAHSPDAILILGDTNSALAAIAAKKRKIPVFHMEAGNRSFDLRVPEELNRKIVDHIADLNLTYSQIARQYLLREGLPPQQVVCIGSPMREVLTYYQSRIDASTVLDSLGLQENMYFVVSLHREENVDRPERLAQAFEVLSSVAAQHQLPVLVSLHPRTRSRIQAQGLPLPDLVRLHKPFGFLDYVRLQQGARAVLSDSGTITEESSILNFPAINLRDAHERPEGCEEAAVIFTGLDSQLVLTALELVCQRSRGRHREINLVKDYAADNVSVKVLSLIHSYTHYLKRKLMLGS